MDTLVLERRGPVAWLRLNRPTKRNAQTLGMWEELRAAGAELVGDPGVRCLVVTGEGPSFSAGIDFRASPRSTATPSGPGSSSRSPATCAC
jgi:enoyl-CoA hydratase/carnithine racemase